MLPSILPWYCSKIARNFTRVHDIERELAELQLQLRMNIGPKKQAMELLRRKIEAQALKVSAARAHHDAAKKAFEAATEALVAEEAAKNQLCNELSLLVQQANRSQLEKLQQLASRVDLLNNFGGAGTAASGPTGGTSAASQTASAPAGAVPQSDVNGASAPVGPQPNGNNASHASVSASSTAEQQARALQKQQAAAEAAAARSRHVSLGGRGRGRGGSRGAPVKESIDESGTFRGFD